MKNMLMEPLRLTVAAEVAQSSEWIICIISYTYNPSTAPWGVKNYYS